MSAIDAAVTGLHAWGDQLAAVASSMHVPSRTSCVSINEALEQMGHIDLGQLHTSGWELSHAFAPRNDNLCGERALLSVQSVAQRALGGDMHAAYANLAQRDGRLGAVLVAFKPSGVSGPYNRRVDFHAAGLFKDVDGRGWVYDPVLAKTPNGIMSADEWLLRTKVAPEDTVVSPATASLPTGRASMGLPTAARALPPDGWHSVTNMLAQSWTRNG